MRIMIGYTIALLTVVILIPLPGSFAEEAPPGNLVRVVYTISIKWKCIDCVD